LHDATPPPITIMLDPLRTHQESSGPLAEFHGVYTSYVRDGIFQNLEVRFNGTFSIVTEYEPGDSTTRWGTAELRDGSLWLTSQPGAGSAGPAGLIWELIPVKWGDRNYLIPKYQLSNFRHAIHDGTEPRNHAFGTFLLREGDWDKPVKNAPQLPAE
jgi:hypothetical protein